MKKFVAASLLAVATLGLSACGEKANESAEVTNEVDANMTAEETVADINATAENAVDAAGNAMETANETGANVAEHAEGGEHNAM